MKGCFVLQRNFAYIGHNLALLLKEKYGIDQFCGYVYMRSSYDFLKAQTEMNYTNLLLDEEIHKKYKDVKLDLDYLKWLEQEYGIPNLWPYIMLDRVVISNQLVREYPYDRPPYTHEEMLKIVQIKARAIIEFLDREKPDFILFSVIGAIGTMLLFQIAKKRGIKTIVVHPAYIKNIYLLSDEYNSFSSVEKTIGEYVKTNSVPKNFSDQAQVFLDDFRARPHPHWDLAHPKKQPVNRSKQFRFLLPKNFFNNLVALTKNFYNHYTNTDRFDYNYIGPWNYLKDGAKRKIRNLIGVSDLYDEFDPREDYAFYPLHYEPEIAISLFAPFFSDQIALIKLIARSLPVGHKLYVKEHPAMVVYRPRSYYQELKKIPNVKIINPAVTSFEIIPFAKLVATISGTAGWEATLLKKPVITFGDVFYNQLSFVKNCKTPEQVAHLVKEQIENFQYSETELVRLITAIYEESTEVPLGQLWEQETDMAKRKAGLGPLADLLMKKINL
ncbi:MAG: hypothetical protein Q7S66_03305 [bacterium]|nr:hypothetical protein [bacterium]